MRTALCLSLAGLIVFLTGCGSIGARWSGRREPYAGVKVNMDTIRNYHTEGELIAIADLPFSAIADTFLLPYDLSGDRTDEPKSEPVVAAGTNTAAHP
jgi:uncharacterized protein YceK